MNFGGPALGIIGCRGENLIRQLQADDWHDNNPRRKGESVQHGPSNQGTATFVGRRPHPTFAQTRLSSP